MSSRTCATCGRITNARRCPTCQTEHERGRYNRYPWRHQRDRYAYRRQRKLALQGDGYTCRIVGCGHHDLTGRTLESHHLVPLVQGGSDELAKLLTVCRQHHRQIEAYERQQARAGGI